jgi:hypothetical protein
LRQWGAAERTETGKEGGGECVYRTSEHANHSAPAGYPGWRNVERD